MLICPMAIHVTCLYCFGLIRSILAESHITLSLSSWTTLAICGLRYRVSWGGGCQL